jgi:hypothetical protein
MVIIIRCAFVEHSNIMPEASHSSIDAFELGLIVRLGLIVQFFQPAKSVDKTASPFTIQLFFQHVDLLLQGLELLPFDRAILLLRCMITRLMATVTSAAWYLPI